MEIFTAFSWLALYLPTTICQRELAADRLSNLSGSTSEIIFTNILCRFYGIFITVPVQLELFGQMTSGCKERDRDDWKRKNYDNSAA
jgi:hypothetical protein